jgi:exopolysaccharide biosynthesis protein
LALLLPSAATVSYAELEGLPIDYQGGVPPHTWGYLDENTYEDPSVSVKITYGRFEGTDWTSVLIKVATPAQVRTLLAGKYGSTQEARGAALAKRVNAVLAVGGDFFCYHNYGYIVRQGNFYRSRPTGAQDVLVIDKNGDFDLLIRPDKAAVDAYEAANKQNVVNAFTFGPALVKDGLPISPLTPGAADATRAQRIALGQAGPLTYRVVYAEGPSDEGSAGLTMPLFARLVASFPDVTDAYNLDGGSSATIVFREEKINGPREQKGRSIGDIIYFASAWKGE